MKISIIVPVYNEEETIKKCLEALIDLDYPKNDYEIIVVDGCSTDKTPEIIKNIFENTEKKDFFFKYIRNNKREGRTLARINGANEATNTLLLFIDSRCIAYPNILENIKNINYQPIVGTPTFELKNSISRFYYLVRKKIYYLFYQYSGEEFEPVYIEKHNFDIMPKGTTIFFCDKELFLFSQPREKDENISDDIKLLWNIVQKKKILRHSDVKVKYLPRNSLKEEIKHTFQRGPKFVDYYLDIGKKFFWLFIFLPLILLFSMIFLYINNSVYFIYSLCFLFFINLLIAIWISENIKDFFSFLFIFPIIGLAFQLGILKGLKIKLLYLVGKARNA